MKLLRFKSANLNPWLGGAAVFSALLGAEVRADPLSDFTSAPPNQQLVVCAAAHTVLARRTIEAMEAGDEFYSVSLPAMDFARFRLVAHVELDLARQRDASAAVMDAFSKRVEIYLKQAPGLKDVSAFRQLSREHCEPQWTRLTEEGAIRQQDLEDLEERQKPELTEQVMAAVRRGKAKADAKAAGH